MSRSSLRPPLADLIAVLGAFLLLGLVSGVLWWLVVDPAQFTGGPGGASMSELELGRRFDNDGWYAVIALAAGFVGGLVTIWWRRRDVVLTTLLLVPGAGLAAGAMAAVGHALGPSDPAQALSAAARGQAVPVELTVSSPAAYVLWPVAVLIGALLVLLSSPRPPAPEQSAEAVGSEASVEPRPTG